MTQEVVLSNINIPEKVLVPSERYNVNNIPSDNSSLDCNSTLYDEVPTSELTNPNRTLLPEFSMSDLESGQKQVPWSCMKKCYVFGFCFFPLWYFGSLYVMSKKKEINYWARLCALNAVLISIVIFGAFIGARYAEKQS
ncbi:13348_t:CDS:1 [Funneliformis mosseae]|uniref:13348_t:CDS:1 n=1 Tax=Funneliformis mosseae TaxID=27381 RepID=A0A9N9FI82_FUNMO|nr:13348_t:CDS:1 [Funneliformis mosseae]